MKVCKKCNQEKEYSEYYQRKVYKDGYLPWCKECVKSSNASYYALDPTSQKIRAKRFHKSKEDKYHRVYLLPNYTIFSPLGYVGITDNVYARMCWHKGRGRDITNYTILEITKSRDEALRLEKKYHDMGYDGRHARHVVAK